jgi:uncharacterized protein (DUF1778 family)
MSGDSAYKSHMLNETQKKNRSERIEARATPDVLALVRRAAEIQGRSVSDFVVSAAEQAARQAILEGEIIRLSVEDQGRFVDSLLSPATPTPAMERAFQHRRRLLKQ